MMKPLRAKIVLGVFVIVLSFTTHSQEYSKETIELWENQNIPFNKEKIVLEEITDSTGRRISQISVPELYVYRKKEAKENGTSLLYIPGGGYSIVSLKDEGEPTARHFLKLGFDVVAMLKYRLPDERIVNNAHMVPLCDAQKALAMLHRQADSWSVSKQKIVVMGGSAGAHLAASLANLTDEIVAPGVKSIELEQAISILLYPVISFNLPYRHNGSFRYLLGELSNDTTLLNYFSMEQKVTQNTPPTYLVHALDDKSVPFQNSEIYEAQLKNAGIPCKLVELEKGGHGFGLNFNKTGVDWTADLMKWLNQQTAWFGNSESNNVKDEQKLKIILKLDDLFVKEGVCDCLPTFEILKKKQIKAGFGIIPSRCDTTLFITLNPYLEAKNNKGEPLFEIWHHGWDHVRPEFKGTDYGYQKAHFEQADKKVNELLGIQMHTFGTPFNAGDSITNRVISENSEYKIFMFSNVIPGHSNNIKYLANRTNMEKGTGNPEFSFFVENYQKNKEKFSDYMILQAHPNNWTTEKLNEFENIIDFLISENCEFILPIEL